MLLPDTDYLAKYKKKPCMEGVKHTNHRILQIVPGVMPNISWNLHENPSTRFPVMLLNDKQTHKQTG